MMLAKIFKCGLIAFSLIFSFHAMKAVFIEEPSVSYSLDILSNIIDGFKDEIRQTRESVEKSLKALIEERRDLKKFVDAQVVIKANREAIVKDIQSADDLKFGQNKGRLKLFAQEESSLANELAGAFEERMALDVSPAMTALFTTINNVLQTTPYVQDVELIKDVVKDYIIKKATVHILKDLGFVCTLFTWCQECDEAPLTKRIALVSYVVHEVKRIFPDRNMPLVFASFAAGKLLQEFLILKQIQNLGYTNLTVNIIDFSYGSEYIWLVKNPGLYNVIIKLQKYLKIKELGGYFMKKLLNIPGRRKMNIFDNAADYIKACTKNPLLKSNLFMTIDTGYAPVFSKNAPYRKSDTNGVIFYINNHPRIVAFMPKYSRPHIYIHRALKDEIDPDLVPKLLQDIEAISINPAFASLRKELEVEVPYKETEFPSYISAVSDALLNNVRNYVAEVQPLYFIDPNLVAQEIVINALQPSNKAILINCDWFEELHVEKYKEEDFKSLYERDCFDHHWIPAKLSPWPPADVDEDWIKFHGNFEEVNECKVVVP